MLDQAMRKAKAAKQVPKFKAHLARVQVKRRKPRVIDSLPEAQIEYLREQLLRLNRCYRDVAEGFADKFGRRLTISTLQRWFSKETRPKSATHDEITVNFSLRFTVPKGATIHFNTSEVRAK